MIDVLAAAGRQLAGRCFSGLWSLLLALLLWLSGTGLSHAATYAFRSDSFAWESAATPISWVRTCTSYPGDDDRATIAFSGGFRFRFAGTNFSSVIVLSNGGLAFVDSGFHRSYSNTTLPAGTPSSSSGCARATPTQLMLPYWTDLDPSRTGSGAVTWEQKGSAPNRYVVISWNGVYQYSTTTPYAFQVILYESGEFKFQYGNGNASGSNATIGVQVDASDYTLYSYKSGYSANGSAIRWFIPSGEPARVAEYRMDETSWSGNVGEVADSSGNGHAGVRVGSASTTAGGKVCRALQVPANTNSTIAAVDTALDVDTGIGASGSLSMWLASNVVWSSSSPAVLADATMLANRPFNLMRMGGGALRFVVADSAGALLTATTAGQSHAAGSWVHVAVTWHLANGTNQSTLRVYVNGLMVTTALGTTNGSLDSSLGSLFIGDNRSTATPSGGSANSANGSIDEVRVYNYELSAAELALDMAMSHDCAPPLHHLEIRHGSGSLLTCAPTTLTLAACQDADCQTLYTGGVTGTLSAAGPGVAAVWPDGVDFAIPAGTGTLSWRYHQTTVGTATLATSSVLPAPANAITCSFGSPQCTMQASEAGLVLSAPDHVSDSLSTLTVSAVKKSDNSLACVPAFANVTRAVNVKCSYTDPASGTLAVRVAGTAANSGASPAAACDASGRAVNLAFNASGVATSTLQYADVGRLGLSATYTGSAATSDTALVMSGSTSFVAAPASFGFSGITVGPLRAGAAFSATVTARNANGVAAPNFGREASPEAVTLSHQRRVPTGAGAHDGLLGGSFGGFSAGSATATDLSWSEVGSIDLSVALASGSYLGSGLGASGSTGSAGAVGPFIPHHFDVAATAACGTFSYAGQPFAVTVTARNGLSPATTTLNFDGSPATAPNQAQSVTLGEAVALGLGSWIGHAVPASAFIAGIASAMPSYGFTSKATAPQSLTLRAANAGAGAAAISSAGHAEGSMALRSGRLRLSNAFGKAGAALQLPVVAEHWSGNAWVLNSADSCTSLPAASVALSNPRSAAGGSTAASTSASAITLGNGSAMLTLAAPSPAGSGLSLDIAVNLGSTAADQSCHASHPATTGAAQPWLRALNGACAASADRDPAARASFGIFSPETRKTVHVREIF